MRSWLVTGGVGFIGYHVSRVLLTRGDRVAILDDFSPTPYPTAEKRRNEHDLRVEFPSVRIVSGCVTDRTQLNELMHGVDGVIHLAGLAGVRPSFRNPTRYAHVNVVGTATVLEVAREHGVKRILFASSSSVYGNSTPLPASEEAPAVVPESPYGASKRSAELIASAYARLSPDTSCIALRFFTVYGPRQRPEMAITLFARALLARRPITVFGDGTMRRDFTHVDDIVRGILAASEKAPAGFRVYNLGSGAPIDLTRLVHALSEAAGIEPLLERGAVPLGDVEATFADIARAQTELGFCPQISLRDGLTTVIDWVKKHP
jgi:UDP-glucuronate 4-epimerase